MSEDKQKLIGEFAAFIDAAHSAQTGLHLATRDVPALTTEEVVERGLLLSKKNPTSEEIARVMHYVGLAELESKFSAIDQDDYDKLVSALLWNRCESERQEFRARLKELMQSASFVSSPAKALKVRKKHKSADMKILQAQMLITTQLDSEGFPDHKYYPRTIEAACKYVLLQIYRKKDRRWERLRECPHCQSYFLRKRNKSGGRPRDYCTAECQKKADQKKALVRQRSPQQRAKQRKRKRLQK